MVRLLISFALAVACLASDPKPKATDYPAHSEAGKLALGAEYMVHSFSGGGQMFVTDDYLVVEVAIYPPSGTTYEVNAGRFSLRINGAKRTIPPQAPSFVAASLKYPDWEQRPRAIAQAGPVIIGAPPTVGRFPGDPTPRQTRLPDPPRAPEPENRSGVEREPPKTGEEVVVESALPGGPRGTPVAGNLYFAYKGKVEKIRKLELLHQGPEGASALQLVP